MARQPKGRQGNSEHVEPSVEFHVNIGTTPSQCGGAPEMPERGVYESKHRLLLQAAFKGDWKSAEGLFQDNSDLVTANITSRKETMLHVAALNAHDQFVKKLIRHLSQSQKAAVALASTDHRGRTALHHAVLGGNIHIVKALVTSNGELTKMRDIKGRVPFNLSTQEASMHKEITWFLAKNTSFNVSCDADSSLAIQCIVRLAYAGHLDIVLYLLERYPSLILEKGREKTDKSILGMLARVPSHFRSGTRLKILEELLYKCIPVDVNYKPMQTATNQGLLCNLVGALQCLTRPLWNIAMIVVPSIKRIHDIKLKNEAAVKLVTMVCDALSEKNDTEINKFFQHRNLLVQATINGISEILKLSIQYFPELIQISCNEATLMTLAVEYRHDRIVSLFLKSCSTHGLSLVPTPTQTESDWMMSAAANYYPDFDYLAIVIGAAFQMQRELQWFKAVESWVAPDLRTTFVSLPTPGKETEEKQNDGMETEDSDGKETEEIENDGVETEESDGKEAEEKENDGKETKENDVQKTYWQMFVDNHEKLIENGQKWVKDTADKCMLVSTLIATVLFAAIFTVPGNNDNKVVPLKGPVLVFVIFDGLGLLSSVMATLLFLAILTSRHEPLAFLDSLPKKIIWGLSSLFLSLVFMLVSFAATLTIVLDKTLEQVAIPIALLTSLPVAFFVKLQLPLLFQMIKSTYGPSIFRSEGIWKM